MKAEHMVWPQEHRQEPDAAALLGVLFEQQWDGLCVYLISLVHDPERAFELAQETFVRAFRARDRLLGVDNPRAWLYRIATNLAWDTLRRRNRIAWLPLRATHPAALVMPGPEAQVEQFSLVGQALATLPLDYRAPLLLYDAYGFTTPEIAEALSISEGAVRTRLYRARAMFRQAYEDQR